MSECLEKRVVGGLYMSWCFQEVYNLVFVMRDRICGVDTNWQVGRYEREVVRWMRLD